MLFCFVFCFFLSFYASMPVIVIVMREFLQIWHKVEAWAQVDGQDNRDLTNFVFSQYSRIQILTIQLCLHPENPQCKLFFWISSSVAKLKSCHLVLGQGQLQGSARAYFKLRQRRRLQQGTRGYHEKAYDFWN